MDEFRGESSQKYPLSVPELAAACSFWLIWKRRSPTCPTPPPCR